MTSLSSRTLCFILLFFCTVPRHTIAPALQLRCFSLALLFSRQSKVSLGDASKRPPPTKPAVRDRRCLTTPTKNAVRPDPPSHRVAWHRRCCSLRIPAVGASPRQGCHRVGRESYGGGRPRNSGGGGQRPSGWRIPERSFGPVGHGHGGGLCVGGGARSGRWRQWSPRAAVIRGSWRWHTPRDGGPALVHPPDDCCWCRQLSRASPAAPGRIQYTLRGTLPAIGSHRHRCHARTFASASVAAPAWWFCFSRPSFPPPRGSPRGPPAWGDAGGSHGRAVGRLRGRLRGLP